MPEPAPPVLVRATRNGVVESVHRGHLAVADADAAPITAFGDPSFRAYVRSAVKPLQAIASLDLLDGAGAELDAPALAVACASHSGSTEHQVEVARILALAGLDEGALGCPPALPSDLPTMLDQRVPTRLAHNCSGKHAAFLLAESLAGGRPEGYLDPGSAIQRGVTDHLAAMCGAVPTGPGVDGCGAPAWILPLHGLATAFARLAGGLGPDGPSPRSRAVRDAMLARPDLVGGMAAADTAMMLADGRIVAKRGAEAVLGAGFARPGGSPVGVAVKIADGGARAAAPAVAAVLRALGARIPGEVERPDVVGGGRVQGTLAPADALAAASI